MLSNLLQSSNPHKTKPPKKRQVSLNNIDFHSPTLKAIHLTIEQHRIPALIDTGSTHNLISVTSFQKLKNTTFTPISMNMQVAGATLKNNIIGKTILLTTFDSHPIKISLPITFLIAHAINNYECILGSEILYNPSIIRTLTHDFITFSSKFKKATAPIHNIIKNSSFNFLTCVHPTVLEPYQTLSVPVHTQFPSNHFHLISSQPLIPCLTLSTLHPITDTISNLTITNSSPLPVQLNNTDIFSSVQLLANSTIKPHINTDTAPSLHIQNPQTLVSKPAQLQSINATHKTDHSDPPSLDIDEEILQDHTLIDSTQLDAQFSYKDCQINNDLPHKIKKKLEQTISAYQSVFAKNKLDVGKFEGFLVELEITADIPPEKKRFMSEEKLKFCEKTFQQFEKHDLISECHTPHTVSNLLLVPKYEGVRDLTKASTYLAQIKGHTNTQFRIVQDLRRINSATKNVKKTLPKLPEIIFQKLKNKIVSSLDALQAYWHMVLHPNSRPYTCFYLNKKIMQFNRVPQGLASAPSCWDEVMAIIFSTDTLQKIKATLTPDQQQMLGDDFEEFFIFYQDDSWIFSDSDQLHLLHIHVVLAAYQMHNIKLSPNKCSFFPTSFKILGVTFSPHQSELALDQLKAQSILDWEKPDSLYTLQSRLYALNYWSKFIPLLAELKFPLNQILRSNIFTWTEEADQSWNRIKAVVALDIRLTVPETHEKLLLTTDASKIAASAILWVFRDNNLRVVGCHSKLFSHTDSLKSIYFKETYALVSAFQQFRPYLLNTKHPITVFTDARSLIWVGRNKEHSIACNGLANKLSKIQLEIPYIVYSVPSETNYLADIFSRAFYNSRFLDKSKFALSKTRATYLPPLTDPCILDEHSLYIFFSSPLNPETSDTYPRNKTKISTPLPIKNLYKLFQDHTPEEKYYSALRLLQGWNDPSLINHPQNNQSTDSDLNSSTLNPQKTILDKSALKIFETEHKDLYKKFYESVVNKTVDSLYNNLDSTLQKRLKATLSENFRKLLSLNLQSSLKNTFIKHENFLNAQKISTPSVTPSSDFITVKDNKLSALHNQITTIIHYSIIPPGLIHPKIGHSSAGIDLPIQKELILPPHATIMTDTLVQLFIPSDFYAQLIPRSSSFKLSIFIHSGVIDNDYNSSIKILIKNTSPDQITLPPGTFLVQALFIPVLHPRLNEMKSINTTSERGTQAFGSSDSPTSNSIILRELQISPLHIAINKILPASINIPEINMNIFLPPDSLLNSSICNEIHHFNNSLLENIHLDQILPILSQTILPDASTLTRELLNKKAVLNNSSLKNVLPNNNYSPALIQSLKDQIYTSMCEKLAVLSIDILKNQSITSESFAKAQQSDDYLSTIRESIVSNPSDFPKFEIKNQVLYKKICFPDINENKYVICIPDILLPSVIQALHVNLGHPSKTTTINNFNHFYYHRHAARFIKDFVNSCTTCLFANKFDQKKVLTSSDRTLKPIRPRQYLYADLIPMFKGTFTYILFVLDAFSQYVYALPLANKTSPAILQGLLSLFASTGWPEALYLDNETSFIKTGKLLNKVSPTRIIYSTPYVHHQNYAETYVKNFKKVFLKTLNDQQSPHENLDWPLLLPTVTQALNRQIIPHLNISRESLHFNQNNDFHPLANISSESATELQKQRIPDPQLIYKKILDHRNKNLAYQKKCPVPSYFETQIVFLKDMAPSTSTILKIPQKGPYRIQKLEERNVTLVELDTGNLTHTHVELIRPLNLKEFRLLLNSKWDLNSQHPKNVKPHSQPSIFDTANNPIDKNEILQLENISPPEIQDEIELDTLFYPPPKTIFHPQQQKPPDITTTLVLPVPNDNISNTATNQQINTPGSDPSINTLHVFKDLSKSLQNKYRHHSKNVSFFLTKFDQYIIPSDPDTSEID